VSCPDTYVVDVHGGASQSEHRYVGADRRHHAVTLRTRVSRDELVTYLCVVVVIGILLPIAVDQLPSVAAVQRGLTALRITWAMLFVVAGVLRLVRWRVTGEARNGNLGAGLMALGLICAPSSILSPGVFDGDPGITLSPVSRALAVTACVVLTMRGIRTASVDSRLRPLRTTVVVTGASWTALLGLMLALRSRPLDGTTHAWAVLELVLASGWVGCVALLLTTREHRRRPTTTWLAINLGMMAVAELLRAVAFLHTDPTILFATSLQLVAAATSVANAGADLSEVFSAEGNRMLSLTGALHATEGLLDQEQRRREERLHDARSVIAALKAASLTLDRYDKRLDEPTKHRLRTSMVSELSRLESVIDARAQQPLQAFRLDVALAPLFIAEQRNGLVINPQLGAVAVEGRPLELVSVIQNLLVNAGRYAPGCPVTVRAVAAVDVVHILVEDRGPGIAAGDQDRIFERGYRAGDSSRPDGSGLGLYLARRLIREQNGDIHVEDRPGGGARFVLTLPRPVPATASAPLDVLTPRRADADAPGASSGDGVTAHEVATEPASIVIGRPRTGRRQAHVHTPEVGLT
jgi:signal transduction histidine kinase